MGKKGEKHVSLTRAQKSKLCSFAKENKHLKQNDLKDWVKETFKLDVNRSTISKILNFKNFNFCKKNYSIEGDSQNIGNQSSKRAKNVNFPELESE
jgi:hypothetical protein